MKKFFLQKMFLGLLKTLIARFSQKDIILPPAFHEIVLFQFRPLYHVQVLTLTKHISGTYS